MFSLYVYPESFLPFTGGDYGDELSYGHRYVESGLHSRRALHWLPHFPW